MTAATETGDRALSGRLQVGELLFEIGVNADGHLEAVDGHDGLTVTYVHRDLLPTVETMQDRFSEGRRTSVLDPTGLTEADRAWVLEQDDANTVLVQELRESIEDLAALSKDLIERLISLGHFDAATREDLLSRVGALTV